MRNLAQYPVTRDEKLRLLDRLIEESMVDLAPGDMRPTILQEIKKDVEATE